MNIKKIVLVSYTAMDKREIVKFVRTLAYVNIFSEAFMARTPGRGAGAIISLAASLFILEFTANIK